MEPFLQQLFAAQGAMLKSSQIPTNSPIDAQSSINYQLRMLQLNAVFQKYCQETMRILESAQQEQQQQQMSSHHDTNLTVPLAPLSPPDSHYADHEGPGSPPGSSAHLASCMKMMLDVDEEDDEEDCKLIIDETQLNSPCASPSLGSYLQDQAPGCSRSSGSSSSSVRSSSSSSRSSRNRSNSPAPSLSSSNTTKQIRFAPYSFNRRPTELSAVSIRDELEVTVRYNENMVRRFESPSRDCSPGEMIKRQRNTLSARISRAKLRVLQDLLREEFREEAAKNQQLKKDMAVKRIYVQQLLRVMGRPVMDLADEWDKFSDAEKETANRFPGLQE
uniref:Uncharacterized protein n=1 Tax=Anopheles albimanus TaxID=7167 RepID=A0A182FE65_ANOAL